MVAHINTVAFVGIDPLPVDVQVQITAGLPAFQIVGLPDKAVAESRERVRSAFYAMGLSLPPKRIVVNLSPADLTKEGSHYDLPIALGVLVCLDILPREELGRFIALGELSLDGSLSKVAGVLATALQASARELGVICPQSCGPEAAWAQNIEVLAPSSLLALINHFKGTHFLSPPTPLISDNKSTYADLKDIKGQETAKRALEVSAAGGHNLLMAGPPGAGKSMLANRLSGILPDLTPEEALEVTMIHSVAGHLPNGKLLRERPFRDPHHSSSLPALIGGGLRALPGEISLAHRGVLFLDELPEFQRSALEALRQPLETGQVTIARANAHVTYPARFQLIAAMNPCRCGYMDDPERACSRTPKCAIDYQAKLSGPLLDRIDFQVFVPAVSAQDLTLPPPQEGSIEVAKRVERARQVQAKRYHRTPFKLNSDLNGQFLEETSPLDSDSKQLLSQAADKLKLSARGYHRVIRVARTLADLEESEYLRSWHIAEALNYRAQALGL
jgi:magnesium chelatase family protein